MIAALVLVAAGTGLLWSDGGEPYMHVTQRGETVRIYGQGLYRYDSLIAGAGHRGVDAVLLLLGLPLLVLGTALHRRRSQRGTLVLAATLATILYVYVTLALGASYNELLLVYTTIAAACALALAQVLPTLDVMRLRDRQTARQATGLGWFLIAVAGLTSIVWLILILEPYLSGAPPTLGGATTYFTPAIDFAFVIPTLLLAGILIRHREPLGYALAAPVLGILVFVGPAMAGQFVSHTLAGLTFTVEEIATYIVTFAIMSGGGAVAFASLLRAASHDREDASSSSRFAAGEPPQGAR